jgi:hypothetical protein
VHGQHVGVARRDRRRRRQPGDVDLAAAQQRVDARVAGDRAGQVHQARRRARAPHLGAGDGLDGPAPGHQRAHVDVVEGRERLRHPARVPRDAATSRQRPRIDPDEHRAAIYRRSAARIPRGGHGRRLVNI